MPAHAFLSEAGGGGGSSGTTINPTASPHSADKTGAVDATTAIRSAHTAASAASTFVLFPPGTYTVNGRIHSASATASPVRFAAEIPGTVIIQRTANVPIIDVLGTRSTATTLNANVAAGAVSVTTTANPSLAANDYVQLRSTTIFSGVAVTTEVMRVKTVTGAGPYTITFYGRTEEAYTTAASAVIEKLNLVAGSTISGITFRQTAVNRDTSANALVQLSLTKDDLVERCTLRDADAPGIEVNNSIDWTYRNIVVDNLIDDLANDRIGYGINVHGTCRDGLVDGLRARFVRHSFTTNSTSAGTEGAPRHITVRNAFCSETSSAALDTHAEGKHITFDTCQVHQMGAGSDAAGIQTRAPFTTINNCTVVGCGAGAANIVIQTGAKNCSIIGGDLIQSGNNSVIRTADNDCLIDGTRITTIGTGYNTTLIDAGAQRTTIRDLDVHQGDNTAAAITYGGGSGHILDGGHFEANSEKSVFTIPSGTLLVKNVPTRSHNSTSVSPYAGAGLAGVTWQGSGYVTSVGSYTMTTADRTVEMTDTTSARSVQLPPVTQVPRGEKITVKDGSGAAGTNNITVQRAGSDTFEDGSTSRLINWNFGSITLYSSGTEWTMVTASAAPVMVAIHNGSAYPARPPGAPSVQWIGPTDPGGLAQNNDTWIPTA